MKVSTEDAQLIKYKLKGYNVFKVVAGLVEKDGKYLIARRLRGNELVIGKWEFPGGKVEEKESESAAIIREMKEEFGLNIGDTKYIDHVVHEYPNKVIDLRLWMGKVLDDDFSLDDTDHDEYKWVKLEEIKDYDLAPADALLYAKIKV